MPTLKDAVEWLINPQISKILLTCLIVYLILLWISLVIWTTKDIISRTNNIVLQMISIILVVLLNVFGVLIYLAIRPAKTLIEKFFEDLEYEALSQSAREKPKKMQQYEKSGKNQDKKNKNNNKKGFIKKIFNITS